MPAAPSKTFTTTLVKDDSMCAIELAFDPKPVFGRARAPVKVSLNGYTFRSTIFRMSDRNFIPLRKSNREAANIDGTETLEVTLALDTDERVVEPPADLVRAMKVAGAWKQWTEMSFTHQREWAEAVEDAKKPETRARRIENAVAQVGARKLKATPASKPVKNTAKQAVKKSASKKPAAKKPAKKPAAKKRSRR